MPLDPSLYCCSGKSNILAHPTVARVDRILASSPIYYGNLGSKLWRTPWKSKHHSFWSRICFLYCDVRTLFRLALVPAIVKLGMMEVLGIIFFEWLFMLGYYSRCNQAELGQVVAFLPTSISAASCERNVLTFAVVMFVHMLLLLMLQTGKTMVWHCWTLGLRQGCHWQHVMAMALS